MIIYLLGIIPSYYAVRILQRKISGDAQTWSDVRSALALSWLSWFGVLICIMVWVFEFSEDYNLKKFNSKPPKWL